MSCNLRVIDKKCSTENRRSRLAPNERNQPASRGTNQSCAKIFVSFVVQIVNPLYHIKCVLQYVYSVGVVMKFCRLLICLYRSLRQIQRHNIKIVHQRSLQQTRSTVKLRTFHIFISYLSIL